MRSDLQQLESVNRLLREVLPANPFYRRKAGGALPDFGSLEDFQREFPLTTRDEWVRDQLDHPPYGTNLTLPLGRYVRCHQTSGTSGRAMRWLDTREGWDRIVDDWATVLRKAGLGARDRYFFAFSFGPFLGFWSAFEAALRIGGLSLPGGGMPTLTRLQAIEENRITVLACTPTYALRMGEAAASTGLDTRKLALRCILVAGEPGGSLPGVRRRLERLWPTARIFDHHGMTETGPATYQCPREAGTLHCIDGSFHAEALRLENGAPARPGEQGELVLTTLGRSASPLIRYRTGDLVELAPRGGCGCQDERISLKGGIIGRCDDMVVVRGVNVYPSAVDQIVRETGEIGEYQVRVGRERDLVELEVRIEPGTGSSGSLARELEDRFRQRLGLRIPVRTAPRDSLPRFEMKARRWVRE